MKTALSLKQASQRGQAMVLFALTLMLLTLMVTMTLSFGTKAKEKMELQQVADQAAFSNAVATARTFNVLAVTNRTMVAHMVALLGVQSAISFASVYFAYLVTLQGWYRVELALQALECLAGQNCGCRGVRDINRRRIRPLRREIRRVRPIIRAWDPLAAVQAQNNRNAASALYFLQLGSYVDDLYTGTISNQQLADQVVAKVAGGAEWRTPNGADSVALKELGLVPGQGAINVLTRPLFDMHAVHAAMSARSHEFTADRSGTPYALLWARLIRALPSLAIEFLNTHEGNAWYGRQLGVHDNRALPAGLSNSSGATSDDHGEGFLTYLGRGCPGLPWPVDTMAFVRSTRPTGIHMYGDRRCRVHRIVGALPTGGNSVWSQFVDYNWSRVANGGDNFAQPKLPTVIQRDVSQRGVADPWNLAFNFRFTPAGKELELGRQVGEANQSIILRDGTDISRQTALSTGIAYYHRGRDPITGRDHFREPPNLFNPFWRAGLTRADIDDAARGPGGDIGDVLNDANAGWARRAYNKLYNAGFRGLQ